MLGMVRSSAIKNNSQHTIDMVRACVIKSVKAQMHHFWQNGKHEVHLCLAWSAYITYITAVEFVWSAKLHENLAVGYEGLLRSDPRRYISFL